MWRADRCTPRRQIGFLADALTAVRGHLLILVPRVAKCSARRELMRPPIGATFPQSDPWTYAYESRII